MKKIAIIPIDNRPICYTLIEQICAIDKDIKLFMPPRAMLGGLMTSSDIEGILNWLDKIEHVDCLIVSLDTIAHGGLVNSRRSNDTYEQILTRILRFEQIVKNKAKKVFAFSSIMRISNNNINEEEKEYWSKWGKRIFEYSYNLHKSQKTMEYNCVHDIVPQDILDDYLSTRKRNFEINKYYLKSDIFDILIFSKDDTGEYGLNVQEAQTLANMGGNVKTGADEIPLSLLSRAIVWNDKIGINIKFLMQGGEKYISKYEDIALEKCVKSQLELANVVSGNDLTFIVNNFSHSQGDLVLGEANVSNKINFDKTKPYFIADVNNANGSDFNFVKEFLNLNTENFYGYCGYNTSANTIGCAICIAVVKFLAKKYDDSAFRKLMLIRFLDDWAYQACIRKGIRENGIESFNKDDFKQFEDNIFKFLNLQCNKIKYSFPWNRSFEIEINL